MRSIPFLVFIACALSYGQAARAQAQKPLPELLGKNACTACHAVDRKVVGPALKDVAAKYRSDKGAHAKLAARIRTGGSGAWGSMPMPPQPGLNEEDLRLIVKQILELK
jgi:cytochrome c551/c552